MGYHDGQLESRVVAVFESDREMYLHSAHRHASTRTTAIDIWRHNTMMPFDQNGII